MIERSESRRAAAPSQAREPARFHLQEMPLHWTQRYMGLAYERGAQGPHAFDCWSFFRHVQRAQFGREVAAVVSPATLHAIAHCLTEESVTGAGWQRTESPRTGDGVLMARLAQPTHVGIYVDDVGRGAILHCAEGAGSVLHTRVHLELLRWTVAGVYRAPAEG